MFLLIPEIIVENGCCILNIQGEQGMEKHYKKISRNPKGLLELLRRENSKALQITDYGSNELDSKSNLDSLIILAGAVDIAIQVMSDFKTIDECRYLLDNGIYRIILSDLALTAPDEVRALVKEYTASRVVASVRSESGKVKSNNPDVSMSDVDLINHYEQLGISRILYIQSDRLDNPEGFDREDLIRVSERCKSRITIYQNVNNHDQLVGIQSMLKHRVDSVVIGKALFENRFPCQKIWREIESELETDSDYEDETTK